MAETITVNNGFDDRSAYAQSFGSMADHTVYQKIDTKSIANGQPKFTVDLREDINKVAKVGMKALQTTSGGVGSAGYALVPIYVDPMIVDETRKYTPAVEIIPRVTNRGMYADYNNLTAKGGAITAAEDASLSETATTYDRNSTAIKFLYAIGRVTGPAIAAIPSYVFAGMNPNGGATGGFSDQSASQAKQMEILVKTREIRELQENLIFNGNTTTSIAGGVDGTEYAGIISLMSTTNTVDKSDSAMSLDDVGTAVRYAYDDGGRPNVGFCSSSVYEDMLALLTAKIGYMSPTQQVFWGFSTIVMTTMVGQIPIIPSMFLSNVSGSKSLYLLDLTVVEMRVLQDLSFQELAKTNDSEKFMLKIYETLIIRNTAFCASITNIK